MTFTYNYTNPAVRDKFRALLGDTSPDDFIFEDEELDIFLSLNSNDMNLSLADACRTIAISTAKQAIVVKLLDTSIDKSQIPELYRKLAQDYEDKNNKEIEDAAKTSIEYINTFAYEVSEFGEDFSEYTDWEEGKT